MRSGNIVRLRRCAQHGMIGIIISCAKPSHLARTRSELRLYDVLVDNKTQCFTGNQMVLIQ